MTLNGSGISRYLTEPPTVGNTLVGLPNIATDIESRKAAHKQRIAVELARLMDKLP